MPLPPLLILPGEASYRAYFKKTYVVGGPMRTFDGIEVRFFEHNFDHAFYIKSSRNSRKKDKFSSERAKQMDWIKAVLADANAELYKRVMPNKKIRRIALLPIERYAVVIQVEKNLRKATFITAYVVNSESAYSNMRSNPKWRQ